MTLRTLSTDDNGPLAGVTVTYETETATGSGTTDSFGNLFIGDYNDGTLITAQATLVDFNTASVRRVVSPTNNVIALALTPVHLYYLYLITLIICVICRRMS